jgi:hypothetical protein
MGISAPCRRIGVGPCEWSKGMPPAPAAAGGSAAHGNTHARRQTGKSDRPTSAREPGATRRPGGAVGRAHAVRCPAAARGTADCGQVACGKDAQAGSPKRSTAAQAHGRTGYWGTPQTERSTPATQWTTARVHTCTLRTIKHMHSHAHASTIIASLDSTRTPSPQQCDRVLCSRQVGT